MKAFVAVLIFAALYAENGARFDPSHSDGPSFIVSAGDYTVRFCEKQSWTIREAGYQGKSLLVPTGFMQPVINEANVPKGADPFLGTGHRKEQVDRYVLRTPEGKIFPIAPGLAINITGPLVVEKSSRFISEWSGLLYEHQSWVTIGESGIHERYRFKCAGPGASNVNYCYAFMHIFTNSTKSWMVGNLEGEMERGEFGDDNSFTLRKDILWAAVYDPSQELGIALIYPEVYPGKPGFKNSFWNRPYDNKLYLQIDPKRTPGEEFEYSLTLSGFKASTTTWDAEAKRLVSLQVGEKIKGTAIYFGFETSSGLDLKEGESISSQDVFQGTGALEIKGNGKLKYRKFPLVLKSLTKYSIRAALKKSRDPGPQNPDCVIRVVNYTQDGKLEIFSTLGQDQPKDGSWHLIEGTFETSANLTDRLGLVLYNNAKESAWFDEIKITELAQK